MSPADEGAARGASAALPGDEAAIAGQPVLRVAAPFAAAAVVAVILGRAIAPSLRGVVVGLDRVIPVIDFLAQAFTQLFAMAAIVLAMTEILAASRIRIPSWQKLGALGLGGSVILVSFLAAPRREAMPGFMMAAMGLSASLVALVAAKAAWRAPFARAAAAVVGLVGAASLVRLAALAFAFLAEEPRFQASVPLARGLGTVALAADGLATCIAAAALLPRPPRDAAETSSGAGLVRPAWLIVLALALVITRVALVDHDDASVTSVLARRSVEKLILHPAPFAPMGLQIFFAVLAPLVAIQALLARFLGGAPGVARPHPALGAAAALAILVRSSVEVPLAALMLVIAALTALLAAHDERGLWSAIAMGSAKPREPSRAPASERG